MSDIELSHDPQLIHWLDKYLYAHRQVAVFRGVMDEAKEEILMALDNEWDTLRVDGRPVLENVRTAPKRFSVKDFKEAHPDVYAEFVREVPQVSMRVL